MVNSVTVLFLFIVSQLQTLPRRKSETSKMILFQKCLKWPFLLPSSEQRPGIWMWEGKSKPCFNKDWMKP